MSDHHVPHSLHVSVHVKNAVEAEAAAHDACRAYFGDAPYLMALNAGPSARAQASGAYMTLLYEVDVDAWLPDDGTGFATATENRAAGGSA